MRSVAGLLGKRVARIGGFPQARIQTPRLRQIQTTSALADKEKGTVKWFNVAKGYGFITPTDGNADVFVHQTEIVTEGFRSLAEGESVEYEISTDQNGRSRATNVTGPDGANPVGTPRRSASPGYSRDYNSYESRGQGY